MRQTVKMDDNWIATAEAAPPHGHIFVIQLWNQQTGKVVDRTRFDSGKLIFLDHRDEFPEFARDARRRLATELRSAQH